jgi:hypothetical protein
MKNLVKVVLLPLLVITFSLAFYGCSDNGPLEKVMSLVTSNAEKSGPSDKEVLDAIACNGENECYCNVVQRDKQTDDGSYPIKVRVTCNDGTVGEHAYNCKKVQNENGNDVWNCPQV